MKQTYKLDKETIEIELIGDKLFDNGKKQLIPEGQTAEDVFFRNIVYLRKHNIDFIFTG